MFLQNERYVLFRCLCIAVLTINLAQAKVWNTGPGSRYWRGTARPEEAEGKQDAELYWCSCKWRRPAERHLVQDHSGHSGKS